MLNIARCSARALSCLSCARLVTTGSSRWPTVIGASLVRRSLGDQHLLHVWSSVYASRSSVFAPKSLLAFSVPGRCIGATRTVVNALSAEPDQPSADHKTSGGLWRTVIKWILRLVGAALFSAAALLALLPSIVSSHRGCSACTAVASKFVPGKHIPDSSDAAINPVNAYFVWW